MDAIAYRAQVAAAMTEAELQTAVMQRLAALEWLAGVHSCP